MGEAAGLFFGRIAMVDTAHDRRRGWIFHIVKPGLNFFGAGGHGKVAECQELCGNWITAPGLIIQFGGNARYLRGIKALAGQIDNSAEIEIVPYDVAEE